jgi:putative restriction endonuclease
MVLWNLLAKQDYHVFHHYRFFYPTQLAETKVVASHIIPWSAREDTRVNPENGLCLCAIHDRAFDRGLISVDAGFSIKLCGKLKESTHPASLAMFGAYSEKHIVLPERFIPNGAFLQWHIDNIFSG